MINSHKSVMFIKLLLFLLLLLFTITNRYIEYIVSNSTSTKFSIPPFFFACIIYYIFFEVVFSFFRKLILERKNPFYPDNKHLHMLLFKFFKKKNILIKANYKTGLCVNFIYLTSLLPLIFFYKRNFFC